MSLAFDTYAELFRIGSRGDSRFPQPGDLFESVIEDIYVNVLSAGDFALDGGAHVGRHAFPMAGRVGPSGLVLAVEAYPKLARELVKRVRKRRLPQVKIIDRALSNQMGSVSFHCVKQHPAYSGIKARDYDFDDDVRVVEVEATTIDALVSDHERRPLRFCKLDLEGGEFRALEGGAATLKNHRPMILFENDQERCAANYGYSKEEWFNFFDSAGYGLFTLWGQPYRRPDWGRRDIPWYFIAAAADSKDSEFVRNGLPCLLQKYL